jgi:hypothetical protein
MPCLSTNQGAKYENLSTVPLDAVCQTCLQQGSRTGRLPANVLVCGLNHAKPQYNDFVQVFEAWIPYFKAASFLTPVSIFFSLTEVYKAGISRVESDNDLPSAASRHICRVKHSRKDYWSHFDAPKDTDDEKMVYDTIGGEVRPLHRKDAVIKMSLETPCYMMQTLNIAGIDVLTFYDSGANNNLVNNKVAVKAGFRLLSCNIVCFGVDEGGTVHSDCGQYAAILGPDGDYHDVECQGVDTITGVFPRFDLIPLHAARYLPGHGPNLPPVIGGDKVKLLIGSRNTQLAPKLMLHYREACACTDQFSPTSGGLNIASADPTPSSRKPTTKPETGSMLALLRSSSPNWPWLTSRAPARS